MTPAPRIALLGAATGLLGVLLSMLPPVLELEETMGLRWLFRARGALDAPAEVAVVSLSGESADALGVSSDVDEWPRALHARVIDRLAAAGAAAIVFDIIFDAPRAPASGDRLLAEAVERAGNVVLLERVREERHAGVVIQSRVRPIEPLRRAALATAPFTLPTVPALVSQFWCFARGLSDTAALPSAALHAYALPVHDSLVEMLVAARPSLATTLESPDSAAATVHGLEEVMQRIRQVFLAEDGIGPELLEALEAQAFPAHEARLLRALIALYAGRDSRYLNYYGPPRTITTIPYHRLLATPGDDDLRAVEGRVVLVGFSESRQSEQQDEFYSVFSQRNGENLSGVEIGATAFANLLHGESITPLPLTLHWLMVAIWGCAIAALCLLLRGFTALAASAAAGLAFCVGAHALFQTQGLWAPLAVPLGIQLPFALLAGITWNYGILRQQRERIQAALGYYLPARVVDRLAHETARPHSSRELMFGTCLVTDAEQYTTLSEALHPAELGELMDAYYDVLFEAVDRHAGTVSDIGGDSMVAVWPAAQAVGASHLRACSAALEVLRAVDDFNRKRVRRELPTRIGIDSGQLLLGNVGSTQRGEYRAVGDIVNTAARLQGLNRLLGTKILLSAATAVDTPELLVRPLGNFLLLGKRTPVSVLELQQVRTVDSEAAVRDLNEAFAAALLPFQRGLWNEAEAAFLAVVERFPGDAPARFFLEQCRNLPERYSASEWDGILRIAVK